MIVDGAPSGIHMKIHELKAWPEPFEAVWLGQKNFEIRHGDRDFEVGDVLRLREYVPENHSYTGREVSKVVTHIVHGGHWGLPEHLCILGWALEVAPEEARNGSHQLVR